MRRGNGPQSGGGRRADSTDRPPAPRTRLHGDRPHVGELPVAEDVERELAAHLALAVDELVQEGWDPAAASDEARRRFGDVDVVRRQCETITRSRDRGVMRAQRVEAVMQDLKYAVRTLVASPGFTLVALLTLALGIGANTAIFSVVNGVLLRPLPYEEPEALAYVQERNTRGGPMAVAYPNFLDWRDQSRSFQALSAYVPATGTLVGGQEPLRVNYALVTADFWRVFPLRPVQGRLTIAEDHQEGAAPALVVNEALAASLGGEVLGGTVELAGVRGQVVGIVPGGFDFPAQAQAWAPLELEPQNRSRTSHNYEVVGRLHDGLAIEAARDEVDALTRRIIETSAGDEAEYADYLATGAFVASLHETLVGGARRSILVLLGAAGFVLLVACTNLASTLLARGTVRSRELAVRSALGAGRRRLIRQLLTESGLLAGAGALAGLGVAALLLRIIRSLGAVSVPRVDQVTLDARVLLFALVVAVGTALLFGLLPALRLTDGQQAGQLRSGGRGGTGSRNRIWGFLVATEVGLALVLLVGAGLLVRSLDQVMQQEKGFDETDVVTTAVALSGLEYPELDDHRRFWDAFLADLEARPQVEAAGVMSAQPLRGWVATGRLDLEGGQTTDAAYVVATAGAFEALDIPLVRGRPFDDRDGPDGPHAVLVSESFARATWPGEDPLGKQVSGGGMDNYWNADPPMFGTVVGVVGDVRYGGLARDPEPVVYFNGRQRPFRLQWAASLVVESASGEAAPLAPLVREAMRSADPDVALQLRTMEDLVRASVAERRFVLSILGGFSVLALVLAAVGIYGVVGYTVARQTREIGVRLALGASPAAVRRRLLTGALKTVALGLVVGVAGAALLTRLLQGFLFGVSATDPATFVAMAAVLVAVALVASWIPARRSTRIDPMITMRAE